MVLTYMPVNTFATQDSSEDPPEAVMDSEDEITSDDFLTPEEEPVQEKEVSQPENSEQTEDSGQIENSEQSEEVPEEVTDEPEMNEEEDDDFEFEASPSDYLAYDPLYIVKYGNPEYIDISEIEMSRFVDIVTAAKGIATYNVKKQKSFEVEEDNYFAGVNYEMPVYNVDDDSDYYVCIPNVNLFNSEFKEYDIMVAYNNDYAETISGYKYEKGILYIPKSAIDNPQNKENVPEGETVAVQLNYAIGGDMDFSKKIPMQILKSDKPITTTVSTENIFNQGFTVKTKVKGRKSSDITVYLNGHLIPIQDDSWEYNKKTGEIYINALPGVVSSINVVFNDRTIMETVEDTTVSFLGAFSAEAHAAVSFDDMVYLKNADGEIVTLSLTKDDFFVGWRGHYKGSVQHGRQSGESDKEAEDRRINDYHGWYASVLCMYGGDTDLYGAGNSLTKAEYDARMKVPWAITSYALGADTGKTNDQGTISVNEGVKHNVTASKTETHTIYEWFMMYHEQMKKSNNHTGNRQGNDLGGATNFAMTWPTTMEGCSDNLISDTSSPDYNRPNHDIPFATPDLILTGAAENGRDWMAASCSYLDDVAESDNSGHIYVTCLGVTDEYVILSFCQARSGQNACAIYKFKLEDLPTGKVTLNKTSQDLQMIEGLSQYSLAGAKYQLYRNEQCTVPASDVNGNPAILTTTADGTANELEVKVGNYYVKETVAPPGYKLSTNVVPITVTKDNITPYVNTLTNNTTHPFTGYRDGQNNTIGQTSIFTLSGSNGTTYTGTCREMGVSMSTSGSGTITQRISNNSKLAKVIYKYGVRWKWWQGENSHKSANNVLGLNYTNSVTLQRLIELACQLESQGAYGFRKVWADAGGNMTTIDAMINWYANVDYSAEVVPDNFELYYVHPTNGSQDFTIWNVSTMHGNGPAVANVTEEANFGPPDIMIYKESSDPDADYRELLDAQFTIKYYDVRTRAQISGATPERQWTFKSVDKTVDSVHKAGVSWATDTPVSGSEFYIKNNQRVLPIGWFTIEETLPPPDYEPGNTIYYGNVLADGSVKYYNKSGAEIAASDPKTFVNEPNSGDVEILKTTDKPALASAYPATSVKFSIYTDSACTTIAQDKFSNNLSNIPINASTMKTEVKKLRPGTYYIKETNAPSYFETPKVEKITLARGEQKTVTYQNIYLKGKAKIKKTTDYPKFEGEYPATDVKFSIYKDSACTQPAVNTDGTALSNLPLTASTMESAMFEVIPGTYYVKESNLPAYFETPAVKEITVAQNDTKTIEFQNKYKIVELFVKKQSVDKTVTDGNSIYNVQGTVLKIYKTQNDAKNNTNAVETLTVGADGNSNKVIIIKGAYYLVETQAGWGYLIPNSLKATSGGKQIVCDEPKTINIE